MQQRNDGTIAFYDKADEQCRAIATLPPSQHEAAIKMLADETGLTPHTLTPIIERYAHLRLPEYPALAKQFCERLGREKVRAMLATNYGQRDLTHHVQAALADERLTITGPRVSLFIDAIKAEFQTASPSELIVWGAPTALLR